MMELENVQHQGEKKPFGLDFFLAAKPANKKSSP